MTRRLVLVVDDCPDIRLIFSTILESRGLDVTQARNGLEAVQLARSQPPDLIFLDLMMPTADGWHAIGRLKKDPATHAIPVVAVSAFEAPPERVRAAGFHALLRKPVRPAEIARVAAICLDPSVRSDAWLDLRRPIASVDPQP